MSDGKEKKDLESKAGVSSVKEELDILVPIPKAIKTLDGKEIEVPKTAWKDEIQIGRLIGKGLEDMSALRELDWDSVKLSDIASVLPTVINIAPDVITGIIAILLKKEEKWVEENLNSDSIMGLLGPFFTNFSRRIERNLDLSGLFAKMPLLK